MRKSLTRTSLLVLIGCLVAASTMRRQSGPPLKDDAFSSVACCTPVLANGLPVFPDSVTTGTYFCDLNCSVVSTFRPSVSLTGVTQVVDPITQVPDSTHYTANLNVADPFFGFSNQNPPLAFLLTYENTFEETATGSGLTGQIWRFSASGDVTFSSKQGAGIPCPFPACIPTYSFVHFVGTIDYFFGPVPGSDLAEWRIRYDLHHACDAIEHRMGDYRPVVNGVPLHPNRSFSLVGPNPVVLTVTPIPWPNWIYPTGEQREVDTTPPTTTCFGESPFLPAGPFPAQGDLIQLSTFGAAGCPCGTSGARWHPMTFAARYSWFIAPPFTRIQKTVIPPMGETPYYYFACRHPTSQNPVFPEGRDVFFFYSKVTMVGPLCQGATISTGEETLTGVTTAYYHDPGQPMPFTARYFRLTTTFQDAQTDITNHLDPPATVRYGLPSWGSWMISGLH